MNISKPFIHRPIATSLLMVAVLLTGLLAASMLPIASLPEVDYPTIQVSTFYPGADPKMMSATVTSPLERQFGQMSGLNQMTSNSSNGVSIITLQFSGDMGIDVAEQEVQASINAASGYLPKGLPNPPVYNKVNPADAPIITLGLTSETLPLSVVADYAETRLAQKLSQILGVGLVTISGGNRPAVRVQVNPRLVASFGISMEDINTAINNANVNQAKGSFDGKEVSYVINANDQLFTAKDYKSLIIAYKNDRPVRLSDVATVLDNVENNLQAAWINNDPAIVVNIQRQPGANVIEVANRIKKLLPVLSSAIPDSVELEVLSDRTLTIRSSVEAVAHDLILAILLVIVVMYVFLRTFSATIIPSLAIPLSLIGSFGIMYLMGFSLNNLTLMALTIATGFVIDDAIVMIENISRFIENGDKPFEAALKGSAQIGFTIVSLTISLIAVLIPLFFMQDIIGKLFKEFAYTLTITIIISAFIALTFTPMLCARMLKEVHKEKVSKFALLAEEFINKMISAYGNTLKVVLRHHNLTLFVAIVTCIITGLMFYHIPKGFFPPQDTGMIVGIIEAEDHITFANMAKKQQKYARIISEDKDIENVTSFIGIDGINSTLNTGRLLITLKDIKERDGVLEIIDRLQEKFKFMKNSKIFLQPVEDLSLNDTVSFAKYQYTMTGQNPEELLEWNNKLVDALKEVPQLKNVSIDQQNNGLECFVEVNRDVAAEFGISMQDVDNALYDVFGQRQISTIYTQRNQYKVVLEGLPNMQKGLASIDNIFVNSSSGTAVPLKSFAKIYTKPASLLISRKNQFSSITTSYDLAEGVSLGEANDIIEQITEKLEMPNKISNDFQGAARIFKSSLSNEGFLVTAAVVVVYIVLGVLYESYIHPITILSTLPSACMGALAFLWIGGRGLDIIGLIGVILLIGIVKKNAIMMIDFALEEERYHNKSSEEAIFNACLLRFRPILMTTLAAVLGAIPLMFSSGMGAELRQPLGISIIGGLLVSQVLTLYTTPVIYLFFDKIAQKVEHHPTLEVKG